MWTIAIALLALCQPLSVASAQIAGLSLKRGGDLQPQGCATFGTLTSSTPRDTTRASAVASAIRRGQEASLVGDPAAARDAYAEAARLDPTDGRTAYHLARAYEELDNPRDALREYCRARALGSSTALAADVDARISRMTQRLAQSPDRAAQAFAAGLAAFDAGEYERAAEAFTEVLTLRPGQVESTFNRALALAAIDRREDAISDFTHYAIVRPTAGDVPRVREVIERLQRPPRRVGSALLLGLIFPGGGLYYTGHPVQGLLATTLTAGGVLYAFSEKISRPAPCPIATLPPCVRDEYTHLGTGLAIAGAVHGLALIEALWLAKRTQLRLALPFGVSVPVPTVVPSA
ncbi:MAG TPA: tetratricopeptide repeat protein, partial [Gemmatimonadaceae bacterium]|nr:tetratricopeptide repeat protein [Gemmatimonadaceae bacterium]